MHTKKQIAVLFFLLFLLIPGVSSAATISLTATPKNIGAGDIVRVNVLLDSTIATNAFSGTLSYTKTMLEPIAISDGNSIINLWVTHPVVPTDGASITFAGITPGGFSGNGGGLFSVLFRAKVAGTASISLADIEVLRNDGAGGKEPATLKPLTLSIGAKSLGGYVEPSDSVPPESFTAFLGTDPQVSDGRNYLVFMAVDKGSGVDHYSVAESRVPAFFSFLFPLSWSTTTSPYVVADQNLTSTVYLRAIDRSGNERLSVFPHTYLFTVYEKVVLLVILIGVVLLWRKKKK